MNEKEAGSEKELPLMKPYTGDLLSSVTLALVPI